MTIGKTRRQGALMGLAIGVLSAVALVPAVLAEELAPGTPINAANIDRVKDMTFEGHRVGDLIPERVDWQIRNHNYVVTPSAATKPMPYDPRILDLTKQHAKGVSIDPATKMIQNYKTGIPFPDIDLKDPQAGAKIVWNYTAAQPHGDQFWIPYAYLLIDHKLGIERVQHWTFSRYYMRARVTEPLESGDGSIYHKTLIFARFPQDIKGLGLFAIRYWDPKLDDLWAYVRTVRRIRRLSGGAWMDPIGGTDQLNDDIETFNAHPSWYENYKLLGKTHAFVLANSAKNEADNASWFPAAGSQQDQYPRTDLSASPYWNPRDTFEVRPVYIVECTPPSYHPYSRKVNYFDAEIWRPYNMEGYDRKGDFWKWANFAQTKWESQDGWIDPATGKPAIYMFSAYGMTVDYQRMHATNFVIEGGTGTRQFNTPTIKEDQFSISVLEEAGR